MLNLLPHAALGLGVLLPVFTLGWVVSRRLHDVSIVDGLWGPAFPVLAWTWLASGAGEGSRPWWVAALATLWGLRLLAHIARRHDGEDPRYTAMRDERFAARSLVTVFWLQAGIAWVLAWPMLMAIRAGGDPGPLDIVGIGVFLGGLGIESVADLQLQRFRERPDSAGRVMDRGLWRYSRHPNYFGESVLWWGMWLIAVSAGAWWTIFAPVLMTLLLLRVSGIPLLEAHLESTRPGYAEYARRTSAFVPWLPSDR